MAWKTIFIKSKIALFQFIKYLAFSNLYIGLCAIGFSLIAFHALNSSELKNNIPIMLTIGLTISLGYQFPYLYHRQMIFASRNRTIWTNKNRKKIYFLVVFEILILGYLIQKLNATQIIYLIIVFLIGLAYYGININEPIRFQIALRNHPILKMLSIASIWLTLIFVFPFLSFPISIDDSKVINLFIHLPFMVLLILLFDWRDLEKDNQNKLRTIPVLMGKKRTRLMIQSLLLIFGITGLSFWTKNYFSLFYLIFSCIGIYLFHNFNTKRSELYYLLFIDGLMLFLGLSIYFISRLNTIFLVATR